MGEHDVSDHTPVAGAMRRFGRIRRGPAAGGGRPDVSRGGMHVARRVSTRWAAAVTAAAIAGGAVAVPAVDGASTRSVNSTAKVKGLPTFSGTVSGRPYGSGKVKGKLSGTTLTATLRYKGGSVRIRGTVTSASPVKGTWRTTGGSGKYRKVKGNGSFTGRLSGTSATLRFRGRIKP